MQIPQADFKFPGFVLLSELFIQLLFANVLKVLENYILGGFYFVKKILMVKKKFGSLVQNTQKQCIQQSNNMRKDDVKVYIKYAQVKNKTI